MHTATSVGLLKETATIPSEPLGRTVTVDFYLPSNISNTASLSLLLINDGQDLVTMGFEQMLGQLLQTGAISPLLCVGIHCGEDRKNEYGMLVSPDFKGRGAKAAEYRQFIFEELLPYLYKQYHITGFKEKAFAGFSLGGLSALDLVWNNTDVFSRVGVFSGSLWWRSKDKSEKEYNQDTDRLMHRQLRKSNMVPGMKFFFECGELDETDDRNRNGVIDSIDDTIDLLRILVGKGYREGPDFHYLQLADGKHDVPTWGKAMPVFLKWGWGL